MGLIRVALALAVLFTHLPAPPFKVLGGGLAVQCFFIVSGFYMALILDAKYRSRTALFYSNRVLRLAPTYFVLMALSAIALFGFGASATASPDLFRQAFSSPLPALVLGFENLVVVGQELLFWFRLDEAGLHFDAGGALPTETSSVAWQALLVPQSWSLSMELVFYALAPWLARQSTPVLLGLAAASIGLRLLGYALPVDYGIWQGRLFPTALFLFLLGMLAHRLLLTRAALAPAALRLAITAALLALIVGYPRLGLPNEPARWLMYGLMALALPFVFSQWRGHRADRWLGELSYPIYLGHLLVVGVVLTYELPNPGWTAIGLTLVLAVALQLLIEGPLDRWRQRRAERAAIA